ncbi:uncharacterized protein T551_00955 [Pneumocystis jirovecii RU7]|uniref:Exocyst complex component Sec8 n=1 Tax=Pneumocystis jirovecii (strain RU7) TaxID=1408657 RepID=A0A0W4ZTI6_PNEJ7|nr:uncharacterized protein T551_00955 [Pneumocystis jirovecii RU7]KTW31694.1 hypothetical protein T551_00955 [Pneumocystis jirovecii RU7]
MNFYKDYVSIFENALSDVQEKTEDWKAGNSKKVQRKKTDVKNVGKSKTYEDAIDKYESVLQQIKKNWNYMTKDECNPLVVALELLDKSSLGKDYNAFKATYQDLQKSLKLIVNENYEEFSRSIATFGIIMENITESQEKAQEIEKTILESQKRLIYKKSDLRSIHQRSLHLKEILRILKAIDDLRKIPEILERHISEKKFLTAIILLKEAQEITERYEMSKINALIDIKRYISGHKNSLMHIILEELHNHLYLKSPYCDTYWAPYTLGQKELPIPAVLKKNEAFQSKMEPGTINHIDTTTSNHTNSTYSYQLNNNNSLPESKKNNIYNPEVDSYEYMKMLTRALYLLNVLPNSLDIIIQRLPVEIYQLIDKTINEVEQRNFNLFQDRFSKKKPLNILDIEFLEDNMRSEILKDFLWTLYSKLAAVLQGYHVIYTYILDLNDEDSQKTSEKMSKSISFNLLEIWKPIQLEIQSLLHDYIIDESNQTVSMYSNFVSFNNMFNEKKDIKKIKMFNIYNINENSKDLNTALSDLKNILNSSVVYLMLREENVKNKTHLILHNLKEEASFTGHRLLIKPSVFNIETLFKPTWAFFQKCKDTLFHESSLSSALTSFLNDFLLNSFLPQLKDIIQEIAAQSILNFDVLQIDENWSTYSTRPLLKNTVSLLILITNLFKMLNSISYNNEDYSDILFDILKKYLSKSKLKYKELISQTNHIGSSNKNKTIIKNIKKISQVWSDDEELKKLLKSFLNGSISLDEFSIMETEKEFLLKNKTPLKYNDIQWDKQVLESLGVFYHTLKWFIDMIVSLKRSKIEFNDRFLQNSAFKQANKTLSFLHDNKADTLILNMKPESNKKLDAILADFKELSESILLNIRIEIRCHIIYYIEKIVRDGNYYLDQYISKPDLYLFELNTDLLEYNEQLNSCLQYEEYSFVIYGLPYMIDNLLVLSAENITQMNVLGSKKMLLNIMILEQNLKNIIRDVESIKFEKSNYFYEIFKLGPKNLLKKIKESKNVFSYDEIKTLLQLQYSEDLTKADEVNRPDIIMALKHSLNENLIELNEYLWQK